MSFILSLVFVVFGVCKIQSLDQAPMKTHLKGAKVKFLAHPKIHKNKNAFVAHLSVPAKGKVPLHRDKTEEYLFILKGKGNIWIDGVRSQIGPNDLVFMPENAEVRFENGNKALNALQILQGLVRRRNMIPRDGNRHLNIC